MVSPDIVVSSQTMADFSTEDIEDYQQLQQIYLVGKMLEESAATELAMGMQLRCRVRRAKIEKYPELKKQLQQLQQKNQHRERYRLLQVLRYYEIHRPRFGDSTPKDLIPGLSTSRRNANDQTDDEVQEIIEIDHDSNNKNNNNNRGNEIVEIHDDDDDSYCRLRKSSPTKTTRRMIMKDTIVNDIDTKPTKSDNKMYEQQQNKTTRKQQETMQKKQKHNNCTSSNMVAHHGGENNNNEKDNVDLDADVDADELFRQVIEEAMSTITMNNSNTTSNGSSNSKYTEWSQTKKEQFAQCITRIRSESQSHPHQQISDRELCTRLAAEYIYHKELKWNKRQVLQNSNQNEINNNDTNDSNNGAAFNSTISIATTSTAVPDLAITNSTTAITNNNNRDHDNDAVLKGVATTVVTGTNRKRKSEQSHENSKRKKAMSIIQHNNNSNTLSNLFDDDSKDVISNDDTGNDDSYNNNDIYDPENMNIDDGSKWNYDSNDNDSGFLTTDAIMINGEKSDTKTNKMKWNDMYGRLLKYKKKHQSTSVPSRFDEDSHLGIWVSTQRKIYNNTCQEKWNDMYERLLKYKNKYQSLVVPYGFDDGRRLGRWVSKQRQKYKNKSLSTARINRLNSIGFVWGGQQDARWMEMYHRLVEYKKQNNSTCVSSSYKANPQLAQWVQTQRSYYKKQNLTTERIEQLGLIDFFWNTKDTNKSTNMDCGHDDHSDSANNGDYGQMRKITTVKKKKRTRRDVVTNEKEQDYNKDGNDSRDTGPSETKEEEGVVEQEQEKDSKTKLENEEKASTMNDAVKALSNTMKMKTKTCATVKWNDIHANDVLCGRGHGVNDQTGNIQYRKIITSKREEFSSVTDKVSKRAIATTIVNTVRAMTPPGRFLKKVTEEKNEYDDDVDDTTTSLWFDIGDEKARGKTSQGLREGTSNNSNNNSNSANIATTCVVSHRTASLQLHKNSAALTNPVDKIKKNSVRLKDIVFDDDTNYSGEKMSPATNDQTKYNETMEAHRADPTSAKNTKWMEMYEQLVAYNKEHKSTCAPCKYEINPLFLHWVHTQRESNGNIKNHNLSVDQRNLLESISFI